MKTINSMINGYVNDRFYQCQQTAREIVRFIVVRAGVAIDVVLFPATMLTTCMQETKSVRRQEFYGVVLQRMLLLIKRAIRKKVGSPMHLFVCEGRCNELVRCQACPPHFVKEIHMEKFPHLPYDSVCVALDLNAVYGHPTWRGEPLGSQVKLPYTRKVGCGLCSRVESSVPTPTLHVDRW